jgi:hypothetical protein
LIISVSVTFPAFLSRYLYCLIMVKREPYFPKLILRAIDPTEPRLKAYASL